MTVRVVCIMLLLVVAADAAAETLTRGKNLAVDASTDGHLLMDLAGELWVVPLGGGEAQHIAPGSGKARRPRWSPDATRIAFSADSGSTRGLRIYDVTTGETHNVSDGAFLDLHPAWHPDGERLVFASDRRGSGFDLWETDLRTGLQWRLSSHQGDESEPAWSADGRDLLYVHHVDEEWRLVLREHGQPEEILVTSSHRISGPSWRPDGSLVMYWLSGGDGISLEMVILSTPRLARRYADGEAFSTAPVSWLDKHRMVYSAGGLIRQRLFNAWSSRTVPFRATLEATTDSATAERVRRELPRIDEPAGTLVVRTARLFDGVGSDYQYDRDIVIERGRITSVEARADRPGAIVVDMGDLVVLPGYIDAQARLPEDTDAPLGPLLLAAGVTTVIAGHPEAEHLNTIWSGKALPGPRLLPAEDWPVGDFSALADSQTPGLDTLRASRPALLVGFDSVVARRFSDPPAIETGKTAVVLGSLGNGLPAGIALHAELRALVAAGLRPEQALRAAGVNAAAVLGVDPGLGRVATGAVADLVFVDGDPLENIDDALNVVAVVRNGRFSSVAGLIERSANAGTVE